MSAPGTERTESQVRIDRAATAQLSAMAAEGGRVLAVSEELAPLTHRRCVGVRSERDGNIEWPALLRALDAADPNYRNRSPNVNAGRDPTMPTIRVELFEGRTPEQKRALVAAITEACVRTIGASPNPGG